MRRPLERATLLVLVCVVLSACSDSATGPSSAGSVVDIAGSWSGTLASANNPTEPIVVELSQSGTNVSGTWRGTTLTWNGEVSGTVEGASFSGRFTFTGTASDDSVCTGAADVSGSAGSTALSWTSSIGVVGAACAAPLPAALRLELRR